VDIEFAIEGAELRILQARPLPVFEAAWRETLARHSLVPPSGAIEKEPA
jgi:hypothetical protein